MIKDLLKARIREEDPANEMEQELVLQEIMQQYILAGLSKQGFFTRAVFHGGTCLKIFHGLKRFSEDLDFLLKEKEPGFQWRPLLEPVVKDLKAEGVDVRVQDRRDSGTAVQQAFIKADSPGGILELDLPFERDRRKKIRVKLEVDSNPPGETGFETHFLSFPVTIPVTVQDLPSSFAGKIHALLCRDYVKGRDWYDFLWYTGRKTRINRRFLIHALFQQGPWKNRDDLDGSREWVREKLEEKIRSLNFRAVKADVSRFLPLSQQPGLEHWSRDLFLYQLRYLEGEE